MACWSKRTGWVREKRTRNDNTARDGNTLLRGHSQSAWATLLPRSLSGFIHKGVIGKECVGTWATNAHHLSLCFLNINDNCSAVYLKAPPTSKSSPQARHRPRHSHCTRLCHQLILEVLGNASTASTLPLIQCSRLPAAGKEMPFRVSTPRPSEPFDLMFQSPSYAGAY